MTKIAVLMTCHNRRAKTVACIESVNAAAHALGTKAAISIYLTDDGSSDGTAQAVLSIAPEAIIVHGSGNLFWNGGMREAYARASLDDPDFYLWLNDDTQLYPSALTSLLETWSGRVKEGEPEAIIVGSTLGEFDEVSYGGVTRHSIFKRTTFSLVEPSDRPRRVETFNGNCVLIPRQAAAKVGNLEPNFIHGMGDYDYGLRAGMVGIASYIAPGFVGRCDRDHPLAGSFRDRSLSFHQRWAKLTAGRSLAPRTWGLFCRRHAGPFWPAYWAWPYFRTFASSFFRL